MYIKLTRLDNTPIWINASFVVTIEPRKGGGSVVVPIGDGLDYDVKETPEAVLSLLDGAPAPAVVPVPPPPMLAPTRLADVSPETPDASEPTPPPAAEPAAHPARRTTRSRAKAKPAAETASAGGAADDKPAAAKKPRTPRKAKRSTQDFALPQEPEPAPESAPTLDLAEEQVARLKKMAPGSVRKLQNTLLTQFKVSDPDATIAALVAHEALAIERDHVIWK